MDNQKIKEVLKTEYSEKFDELRKRRMFISFHKYGPIEINYGKKLVDWQETFEKRYAKYKETGNLEFLADLANFVMIEYMHPQHPKAHFDAKDSNKSPGLVGMSYNEIKNYDK